MQHPKGFTGKLLDRYLADGWYRMGARMFTCRYNFYPNGFLTTVWTRLPLAEHQFPKSIAKLLRRNAQKFTTVIHPARALEAEERVFSAYSASRNYDLHSNAAHYITHDRDAPFDTWQVSVYDQETLIGFAYFDRGRLAMQSVSCFFLPEYSKYSIGLYTLALEVEQAKRWGMAYHYSGYIVPGNDTFEYKRRMGDLEAYDDVERSWYPISYLDPAELPDAMMRSALLEYDALYRSVELSYGLSFRPSLQIPFGRDGLSWLRREQLPFCLVDESIAHLPYWACHLYSFNFRRYFTLLCTHHPDEQDSLDVRYANAPALESLNWRQRLDRWNPGRGQVVKCIQYSAKPFSALELHQAAVVVAEANAAARGPL